MAKKKAIHDFYKMKGTGEKITWLTSYDFPTAQFAEAAGLDMILVGDSLGMCVYGYKGTVPVTMDQCIGHCDAVKLEGGTRVVSRIRSLVDAGMVVIGHIGLTPQSSGALGGHKAQGRTAKEAALSRRKKQHPNERNSHDPS